MKRILILIAIIIITLSLWLYKSHKDYYYYLQPTTITRIEHIQLRLNATLNEWISTDPEVQGIRRVGAHVSDDYATGEIIIAVYLENSPTNWASGGNYIREPLTELATKIDDITKLIVKDIENPTRPFDLEYRISFMWLTNEMDQNTLTWIAKLEWNNGQINRLKYTKRGNYNIIEKTPLE